MRSHPSPPSGLPFRLRSFLHRLIRAATLPFAVLAVLSVPAVGSAGAEPVTLHAYVGAGLRGPVEVLIGRFEAATGNHVVAEYGGSGQILARLLETRRGDLFIPGSTVFTDKLAAQGALASSRTLVVHGPVLAVAPSLAGTVTRFTDLARPGLRVGLGDPKAMALGRTAEEILDASGKGDAIRGNVVTRAATVKQLTLYLLDGQVDAAIIGAADASMNVGRLSVVPIPAEWYVPELVPAAVTSFAEAPEVAERFVDLLASPEGLAVFARHGFPAAPAK